MNMIIYEPLYETMKTKGISTYKLVNTYGMSRSLLDRLKHNKPISTVTLNDLCKILDCDVGDILKYVRDSETESE
jgi:putative transcriptional regulator